jgi:hypothetical protein
MPPSSGPVSPRTILRLFHSDTGSMIDWNVRNYLLNNTVSHPRWLKYSVTALAKYNTVKVYLSVMSINVYLTGLN